METPVFPAFIELGDMLKLRNTASGWLEEEEYTITGIQEVTDTTGSFVYMSLNREINPACTTNGSIPGNICKYIINKHVPDETNVILRYSPRSNITEDGLLFPQYVDPLVKDESGNIVKALRAQNLLPPESPVT